MAFFIKFLSSGYMKKTLLDSFKVFKKSAKRKNL